MANSGVAETGATAGNGAGRRVLGLAGMLWRLRTRRVAQRLYANVVAQAREPAFYREFGVPDTADGRFELIALHVFLLMHRFRGEPDMTHLSRALSEEVVADVDRNLRESGTGDLSIGRQVRKLAARLYQRFGVYADAIDADALGIDESRVGFQGKAGFPEKTGFPEGAMAPDEAGRGGIDVPEGSVTLEEALRRHLYGGAGPGDPTLTALVTYVQRETAALAARPAADIVTGPQPFRHPGDPGGKAVWTA